ncbi:MAG: hypothetical protein COB35_04160 [Gammaproteobacteria bacterium]|nr:MAG: hypothetical protein COB35_04160 [Gammaproteobacteria bacterium]
MFTKSLINSKVLFAILIATLSACSSTVEFKPKTVKQITDRSLKKMHSSVITEFTVRSTTTFDANNQNETGIWILSSGKSNNSSNSLNVYLATQVVAQVKSKYKMKNIADFEGVTIKVKGVAEPKYYCRAKMICLPGQQHDLYIQTQLNIENINDLTIL